MQGYVNPVVRVFVLDDHDIVRRGLRDVLTKRDIIVVGDAPSATQATRRILELRPHVMVLDVQLEDGSGVQVCRDVRTVDPTISGLLLTSAGDEEALALAVLAGAAGVVLKLAGTHDIVDAVRRVRAGRVLMDQAETDRAADRLRARAERISPPITPGQEETLSLLLAGHTDQQIATERGQPLTRVREDVAGLVSRLSASSSGGDRSAPGRHRRGQD